MIKIEEHTGKTLTDILNFYTLCGYTGGAKKKDRIFVAKMGNEIVGVVRLCKEIGLLLLRGMQVKESYQKQGIGKRLLATLDAAIGNQECYSLPYSHLENFYRTIGFEKIKETEAPPKLRKRFEEYRVFEPIMVMRRKEKRLD